MESIYLKVALCTECNGYHTATPAKIEDCTHPEIVDHYFYHGEPRFTFDENFFSQNSELSNSEICIIELSHHQENDHQHCNCNQICIEKTETNIYFRNLSPVNNIFSDVDNPNAHHASA